MVLPTGKIRWPDMNSYSIFLFLWEKFNLFCKYTVFLFIYKLTQRYFAFLTQKGAMPQVLGLLRAWLYSICMFVQPRPDGCLSRIKRQSNTAYSIVQPWLDDRVSLICLYKLPDSWRRRQVGEHIRKCIKCLVCVIKDLGQVWPTTSSLQGCWQ